MSVLKKNIAANLVGGAWQSVVSVLFIPVYIRFLGIEAWGLIGLFATLQAVFSLLDMGLSSTLNREMARLSAVPGNEQEQCNLVRTLEVIYWGIALLAGGVMLLLSIFLGHYWIEADGEMTRQTIRQALMIMGFLIALRMPITLYSGAIMGLQRQVLLNTINVSVLTFGGLSSVVILWLVSATIQMFLLWQIVVTLLHVAFLAFFLWRDLRRHRHRVAFNGSLLKGIWRFAAGMSGISVLAVILTQMDKLVLSKLVTLEVFGYYMLASVVGMSLNRLIGPLFAGIYPRFTQAASACDQTDQLAALYHRVCQFMSVIILPPAVVIAFFSYEILLLWTGSPETAERTWLLVSLLICGTAFNGLMNPPFALQLAFGWTRLSVYKNVIAVVVIVPLLIIMVHYYGGAGAAFAWLLLNVGYVLFEIPIMHRRLLPNEKWRWYRVDVLRPLLTCTMVAGAARLWITPEMSRSLLLISLGLILLSTMAVAILAAPTQKAYVLQLWLTRFGTANLPEEK